jgi:hypothetical protein
MLTWLVQAQNLEYSSDRVDVRINSIVSYL